MTLPPKIRKFLRDPMRMRANMNEHQVEDLRRLVLPMLTPQELSELVGMYTRAMNCAMIHLNDMAMYMRWMMVTAYVHVCAIVFIPEPQRYWLTLPAGALVGYLFMMLVKEWIWRYKDRKKHLEEIADFCGKRLVQSLPLPDELAELLEKAFGKETGVEITSEAVDSLENFVKKFTKKKGGATE